MERWNGEKFLCGLILILVSEVIFTNFLPYFMYLKGLPNGFNHEKKGNKRPQTEERLVVKTCLTMISI